jgi:hypothetical protein
MTNPRVHELISNSEQIVRAELERRDVAPTLEAAVRNLATLGEDVPGVRITPARYHALGNDDLLVGIRHSAVSAHPQLNQLLDRLAGKGPGMGVRVQPGLRFG